MIKILKNRGSGKTCDLVRMACSNDYQYAIVCTTEKERKHIKEVASELGYSPFKLTVYTSNEVLEDGHSGKPLLIDNLTSVVSSMFTAPVAGFSMNID